MALNYEQVDEMLDDGGNIDIGVVSVAVPQGYTDGRWLVEADMRHTDGDNTNNELGTELSAEPEFATAIEMGRLVIDPEMSRFYAYADDKEIAAKIAARLWNEYAAAVV